MSIGMWSILFVLVFFAVLLGLGIFFVIWIVRKSAIAAARREAKRIVDEAAAQRGSEETTKDRGG